MYNSKDLEKLCRIIDTFSVSDHISILQIIHDCNEHLSMSENNNGTFINMEDLSEDTLNKIQEYVNYVLLKEGEIKVVEDTKDKLKNDINMFHILNHVENK
jgi:hypothetical protein